jgi:flagellar basal-body rod modification protein FlgD
MTTIPASSAADALSIRNTAAPASGSGSTLDQTAFLKLMTTQLQTQDPFNPVDNTQMVAQMAQFSSVAGISEMNTSLKAIQASLAGSRVGDAANWIGRAALVQSDIAAPLPDGSYRGEINLPKDASALSLSFVDSAGQIVHQETLGAQPSGPIAFAWDGKGADGSAAATGPLRLLVTAAGPDGQIAAGTSTWTGISAVQSPAGGGDTKLVTPLGLIAPADALRLG